MNGFESLLQQVLTAIGEPGLLEMALFVPLYIFGTLLLFPNPLLTFTAGALFGLPLGFALISLSSVVSAGIVFLSSRRLSRGWILKRIASSNKVKAVDDAVTRGGWKMVFLLRLTALLPFSIMNYALGLSEIRFKHYLLASWIGMMPGTLLYVYLGSRVSVYVLEADKARDNIFEWILFAISILVTFVISIYATHVIKKAHTQGSARS